MDWRIDGGSLLRIPKVSRLFLCHRRAVPRDSRRWEIKKYAGGNFHLGIARSTWRCVFFTHHLFFSLYFRLTIDFRNEVVKKKYLNAWKSDGGGEEYVYSSFFQLFLSPSLRSSMCRLFVVALLGWFTNSTVKSQTNKQNAGVLRQLLFLFRVLELGDGITRSDFLPIVFIVLIAPIVGFLYQHYFK
jgi:hypothetical protein